jgi:hypothetical protein
VPRILNSALIGGEWLACDAPASLHYGKRTRYPLVRRLSGTQIRFERGGEEK